jgi:regulator of sigma E protease
MMQNLGERMKRRLRHSRVMVYGIAMPMTLAFGLPTFTGIWRLAMVLFGFSLIIFLHELGHIVVARMCGVKCLAFSVGIGPRMFGWRKGGGFTYGGDPYDPEVQEKKARKLEKTVGEKEDDKYALKTLEGSDAVSSEKKVEHFEAATTHSDLPQSAPAPKHPANLGDTDYRWSWLPLGGYVRMLGQDDMDPTKVSTDPRAFNQRPIWQRMCIVSAGVIMNLIFAAVAFSILFSPGVGVDFPPADIGGVAYNSPAWKGGLRMGDKIVSIDGWRPARGFLEFTDIKINNALSSGTDGLVYEYERPGEPGVHKTPPIVPIRGADGFLSMGVGSMPGLKLPPKTHIEETADLLEKSRRDGGLGRPALGKELRKMQGGELITKVNGEPVKNYPEMFKIVQEAGPKPVTITVQSPTDKREEQMVVKADTKLVDGVEEFPKLFGLAPPLSADLVVKDGAAAKAKMEDGDVILSIGARERPTEPEFRRIVKESGGKTVRVTVLRGDKVVPLDVAIEDNSGTGVIGVLPGYQFDDNIAVIRDRNAETLPAELQRGESLTRIVKVDGQPVSSWGEILWRAQQKKAGDKIELTFAPVAALAASTQTATTQTAADTQGGNEIAATFGITDDMVRILHDQVEFRLNLPVEVLNQTQVAESRWGAVMMGVDHTEKFVEQVYMTLAGLVRRTVSPSELHGMLGITLVGYQIQERGPAWFWYLMAMVSVNLAVANFLPLPIVDGGLFLLLILEKIRGKPLSLKVQSAIQVVGIVLLAGMFLFVTINDLRLFGK